MRINIDVEVLKRLNLKFLSIYDFERISNMITKTNSIIVDKDSSLIVSSVTDLNSILRSKLIIAQFEPQREYFDGMVYFTDKTYEDIISDDVLGNVIEVNNFKIYQLDRIPYDSQFIDLYRFMMDSLDVKQPILMTGIKIKNADEQASDVKNKESDVSNSAADKKKFVLVPTSQYNNSIIIPEGMEAIDNAREWEKQCENGNVELIIISSNKVRTGLENRLIALSKKYNIKFEMVKAPRMIISGLYNFDD